MGSVRNTDGQLSSLHTSIFLSTFCYKTLKLFVIYITNALKE